MVGLPPLLVRVLLAGNKSLRFPQMVPSEALPSPPQPAPPPPFEGSAAIAA